MHAGGVAESSGPWNDDKDPFEVWRQNWAFFLFFIYFVCQKKEQEWVLSLINIPIIRQKVYQLLDIGHFVSRRTSDLFIWDTIRPVWLTNASIITSAQPIFSGQHQPLYTKPIHDGGENLNRFNNQPQYSRIQSQDRQDKIPRRGFSIVHCSPRPQRN